MPDLIVSSDIDTLLSSASTTAARTNLGLGSTDTVEFGALETSHLNFPNLTTSELNAVTDAVEGDTYFDSNRGQFARFTGAASYDVVTARARNFTDSLAPITGVTLATSGFLESGLILESANVFSPAGLVFVHSGADNIDGQNFSSVTGYLYHDGSFAGADEGWYETGTLASADSVVLPANSQIRFITGSTGREIMYFNMAIVSDVTDKALVSETLLAGVTYGISVKLSAADMLNGNLRFDTTFTGLFEKARALFTADDVETGTRLGTLTGTMSEAQVFAFSDASAYAFDSPALGFYDFNFTITPSSDGVFTMTVRQATSDVLPLYINKAEIKVTSDSD